MSDVTRMLEAIDGGDPHASDRLFLLVYDELRRLAAHRLADELPGQTFQPTALVNETYLRLVDGVAPQTWNSRGHFFAAASEAMRRVLVDSARRKRRVKRGGGRRRAFPDLDALEVEARDDQVLALNEALEAFAAHDPVKAKLVELRFFGGLTLQQAADCLNISLSTADRGWRYARAWLYDAMSDGGSGQS